MAPSRRRTISQRSELIHDLHTFNINPDTRELFIHGVDDDGEEPGVDYRMATILEKNLRFLQEASNDPILIHMHTIGGEWNDGIAMYDAIKHSTTHVTILAYAHARSMSSIIFQAADTRVMMPHADFMIHYGTMGMEANMISVISAVEWEKHLNEVMLDIYVKSCVKGAYFEHHGMDEDKIRKFLDGKIRQHQEWYINAADAVHYGFADGVLGDSNYPDIPSLIQE